MLKESRRPSYLFVESMTTPSGHPDVLELLGIRTPLVIWLADGVCYRCLAAPPRRQSLHNGQGIEHLLDVGTNPAIDLNNG